MKSQLLIAPVTVSLMLIPAHLKRAKREIGSCGQTQTPSNCKEPKFYTFIVAGTFVSRATAFRVDERIVAKR